MFSIDLTDHRSLFWITAFRLVSIVTEHIVHTIDGTDLIVARQLSSLFNSAIHNNSYTTVARRLA